MSHACSPQRAERRTQLFGEQLRLFPRGEVAAPFGLVEVDQVVVRLLGPAARRAARPVTDHRPAPARAAATPRSAAGGRRAGPPLLAGSAASSSHRARPHRPGKKPWVGTLARPGSSGRNQADLPGHGPSLVGKGRPPPDVSLPVAFTVFPVEIFQAPRSWAEKVYPNLVYFHQADDLDGRAGDRGAGHEGDGQYFTEAVHWSAGPAGHGIRRTVVLVSRDATNAIRDRRPGVPGR